MKTRMFMVASIWMLFVSAALPVHAQAGGVKVNVPFDFAVSDKMFRAGQYTMIEAPLGVSIQDERGVTVAMALANDLTGRSVSNKGQVIFHCYSEHRCFLSEVWSPSRATGRELLVSGTESDFAKESAQRELALLGEVQNK
jgi:hypothetical protein